MYPGDVGNKVQTGRTEPLPSAPCPRAPDKFFFLPLCLLTYWGQCWTTLALRAGALTLPHFWGVWPSTVGQLLGKQDPMLIILVEAVGRARATVTAWGTRERPRALRVLGKEVARWQFIQIIGSSAAVQKNGQLHMSQSEAYNMCCQGEKSRQSSYHCEKGGVKCAYTWPLVMCIKCLWEQEIGLGGGEGVARGQE